MLFSSSSSSSSCSSSLSLPSVSVFVGVFVGVLVGVRSTDHFNSQNDSPVISDTLLTVLARNWRAGSSTASIQRSDMSDRSAPRSTVYAVQNAFEPTTDNGAFQPHLRHRDGASPRDRARVAAALGAVACQQEWRWWGRWRRRRCGRPTAGPARRRTRSLPRATRAAPRGPSTRWPRRPRPRRLLLLLLLLLLRRRRRQRRPRCCGTAARGAAAATQAPAPLSWRRTMRRPTRTSAAPAGAYCRPRGCSSFTSSRRMTSCSSSWPSARRWYGLDRAGPRRTAPSALILRGPPPSGLRCLAAVCLLCGRVREEVYRPAQAPAAPDRQAPLPQGLRLFPHAHAAPGPSGREPAAPPAPGTTVGGSGSGGHGGRPTGAYDDGACSCTCTCESPGAGAAAGGVWPRSGQSVPGARAQSGGGRRCASGHACRRCGHDRVS